MEELRTLRSANSVRLWRGALLVAGLLFTLHLAWILAERANPDLARASGDLFSVVESTLAMLMAAALAAKTLRSSEPGRYAWAFITLALLANTLGEVAWWLIERSQGEVPFPSMADPIYLAFYPFFALGLALLPAIRNGPAERLRLGLDMGSALLAGILLFWVLGAVPVLAEESVSNLELAVALAYPAGDVALLWGLMLLLNRRFSPDKHQSLRLLAAGTLVMLATDSLFSYLAIQDAYVSGGLLDLGYALMLALFGLAAAREWSLRADPQPVITAPQPESEGGALVGWNIARPSAAILLAFGLLVWDHFRPTGVDFPVLAAFLGGIILLVTARQLLAQRETNALRETERQLTRSLVRARDELEVRVDERTRELQEANQALEGEVAQHQLTEANLRISLKEQELLLKEVHHRVKNNLQIVTSLFNLQSNSAIDGQSREALLDGQARVKTMALIHEKLYRSGNLARLDFGDYLHQLTAQLFRTYRADQAVVTLRVSASPVWLNVDTAVPCGLIVNELVANALKHAFPAGRLGTVYVGLIEAGDDRVRLSVIDDGAGLPPDFDVSRANTLGLQLVAMLARQIDGDIQVDTDGGTAFHVTFASPNLNPSPTEHIPY